MSLLTESVALVAEYASTAAELPRYIKDRIREEAAAKLARLDPFLPHICEIRVGLGRRQYRQREAKPRNSKTMAVNATAIG